MRIIALFIIVCLYTGSSLADSHGKLLPVKITFDYKVVTYTYDNKNRVKTETTKHLGTEDTSIDNTYYITKYWYTKDGFTKRHTTHLYNSDEAFLKKKANEEYAGGVLVIHPVDSLYHLISSFYLTRYEGRKSTAISLDKDTYISVDSDEKPVKLTIIDREMFYDQSVCDYTYNPLGNVVKFTNTRYYSLELPTTIDPVEPIEITDISFEYDTRNGIFKDVNSNIVQIAMDEYDTFFLYNNHNVIKETKESKKNIQTTQYQYTYNEQGYPIAYTTTMNGEVVGGNVLIEYKKAK